MGDIMEIEKLVEKNGKGSFDLEGEDGNAFAIMGRVKRGLYTAMWSHDDVNLVMGEMMRGDYNHLLNVAGAVQADSGF